MPTLELHALRAVPPSLANRDDQGLPKRANFAGVPRARYSSQAIKHAMRRDMRSRALVPDEHLADRTRTLGEMLTAALTARGLDPDTAAMLTANTLWGMGVLDLDPKNGTKRYTNVLLFIAPQEVDAIAARVHENAADLLAHCVPAEHIWPQPSAEDQTPAVESTSKTARKAACPAAIKKFGKPLLELVAPDRAVDIALFGRFLAEAPGATVDGAACVAHALGIDALDTDIDYYTAVDDKLDESGFLGTTYLVAPTIYTYAALDLVQLAASLAGDQPLCELAIKAFTTAFITAAPTGKKTSTAPFTRPDLVLAVLRTDQPLSLANAFRRPVTGGTDGDLAVAGVNALTRHWHALADAYGTDGVINTWYVTTLDEDQLDRPIPGARLNAADLAARAAARAVLHLEA
jgi:CRISPR system Cascade subunit CasC